MDLAFAFLALNAEHSTERQLWVAAADFDIIEAAGFPVYSKFCIVVKFRVAPEEVAQPHSLRIELTRPNGEQIVLVEHQDVATMANPHDPARQSGATIIVNAGVLLLVPGSYAINIFADGREVKSLPLFVEMVAQQPQQAH